MGNGRTDSGKAPPSWTPPWTRCSRREASAALLAGVASCALPGWPRAEVLAALPSSARLVGLPLLVQADLAAISPGPLWQGIAGSWQRSDFANQRPVDPERRTAKPAVRLLVPPEQAFTDALVVGVAAGANNLGDCVDTFGLAAVEVCYEGNVARIERPGVLKYRDANGALRHASGWWAKLTHDGRSMADHPDGGAEVYFRAIPQDPSMQPRVIGPYRFYPRATMHDAELVVAPSRPTVPGKRYRTLRDAAEFIRSAGRNFPRILIAEPGLHDWGSLSVSHETLGYTVIEASVPVVIGKAARTIGQRGIDTGGTMRPRLGPLCFRGRNITLDFRNMFHVFHERPENREHWLDGCRMTNSAPAGRAALWRMGSRSIAQMIRGKPYFTEVRASNLLNAMYGCSLARNCTLEKGAADIFTEGLCIYGNSVVDWDSTLDWTVYRPALEVRFDRPGMAATLECSGNNLARSRRIIARVDGRIVGELITGNDEALHAKDSGSGYTFADLAAWLNGLQGWSAQVLDNSRLAASAQIAGSIGPWGPAAVTRDGLTIFSYFDLHSDFYQKNHTGIPLENVVIMDNDARGIVAQNLFLSGKGGCADVLVMGNRFENKGYGGQEQPRFRMSSQLSFGQSHVVIAHNAFLGQNIAIRTDNPATVLDRYCLIADNAVEAVTWKGAIRGEPQIRNNALPSPKAEMR